MPTLTPTRRDLERNVRTYVAAGSGLPRNRVIPVSSNGPRPQDAYAVVGLIRDDTVGYPAERVRLDRNGEIEGVRTLVKRCAKYDVNFYRDTNFADLFAAWTQSANGIIQAANRQIRVKQYGDVVRMDELDDEQWENRAVIQLEIAYNSIYDDAISDLEIGGIVVSHDLGSEEIAV